MADRLRTTPACGGPPRRRGRRDRRRTRRLKVRTNPARPGSATTSTRAETHLLTPLRSGSSTTPLVRGRSSRAAARSVIRVVLQVRVTRTDPRPSVSVTLPRLTRSTSRTRPRGRRRTRSDPTHDLPHDAARRTHDHEDADAHPHRNARTARPGGQQDESVVITRLRPARKPGRHGQRTRRPGRQDEAGRTDVEPRHRGPRNIPRCDVGPASPVERESCAADVDHHGARTGVRDRNRHALRPGQSGPVSESLSGRGRAGRRSRPPKRTRARGRPGERPRWVSSTDHREGDSGRVPPGRDGRDR